MSNNPHALITKEQVGRIADRFSAKCFKHDTTLLKDAVQMVLEDEGDALAQDLFEVFRARVERRANMIVRRVPVNRNRTPQEALDATSRRQIIKDSIVQSMSKGKDHWVEVVFFKVGRFITDADLEKEYKSRGLKPADPYSLAAVNEADLAFADEHHNGTHWKDADNKWCYSSFSIYRNERELFVEHSEAPWDESWWFAGIRR